MAGLTIELDAAGSAVGGGNPDGTAYLLDSTNGYSLLGFEDPGPEQDIQWASSADTEGEAVANARPHNRTVTIALRLAKTTDALIQSELNTLGKKVAKFAREGGTIKVTVPSGTVCYFDVVTADHGFPWDQRMIRVKRSEITLTIPCKPYIRTAEVDLGDNVETTLPVLVFTEATVAGDVPALGRLVIDEDQAVSQWWMTWGIQSRYYDSATSAALFYEAEGRTALGGSATAVGPSGASGGGSNVMQNTSLLTTEQAILSTQATAAGAHLSHVGSFHVYARVQVPTANTGEVTVGFEWSEADFLRRIRNPATTIPGRHGGRWRLVDLGLVTTTKVTSGTQRWEGRITAKSTVAGDDINVDYLFLVPVSEGSGITSGILGLETPSSVLAREDFAQSAGALNTKVAPAGGTWATSGDAGDFQVNGGGASTGVITRADVSDSSTVGRLAILGSSTYAGISMQMDFMFSANVTNQFFALQPRYVDSSNYLQVRVQNSTGTSTCAIVLEKKIAGTFTALNRNDLFTITPSTWYTVQVIVAANGDTVVFAYQRSAPSGTPLYTASDSTLGTGSTLATGKIAFYDEQNAASAVTRSYDNLIVYAAPTDAAAFASQSIEVRSNRVQREDSGGTMWSKPSSYLGDYLLVPPSGAEARTNRVVVKFARNDPLELDAAIDDLSARLFVTPRYLAMPS